MDSNGSFLIKIEKLYYKLKIKLSRFLLNLGFECMKTDDERMYEMDIIIDNKKIEDMELKNKYNNICISILNHIFEIDHDFYKKKIILEDVDSFYDKNINKYNKNNKYQLYFHCLSEKKTLETESPTKLIKSTISNHSTFIKSNTNETLDSLIHENYFIDCDATKNVVHIYPIMNMRYVVDNFKSQELKNIFIDNPHKCNKLLEQLNEIFSESKYNVSEEYIEPEKNTTIENRNGMCYATTMIKYTYIITIAD